MVVCRPAAQFCCGCSVKFGVIFILLLHLLECLWTTIVTALFIMGRSVTMMAYALFSDIGAQTALACFALAGLPIIIAALWGVYHGVETCVRLYLYYLVAAFVFDALYLLHHFFFHDDCEVMQDNMMMNEGRAWACGWFRMLDIAYIVLMLAIPAYFVFIVFSYCEDMTEGGAGPDLSDLTLNVKRRRQTAFGNDRYSTLNGMDKWYSSGYGAAESAGHLGGSHTILNGSYHDIEFPPETSWKR